MTVKLKHSENKEADTYCAGMLVLARHKVGGLHCFDGGGVDWRLRQGWGVFRGSGRGK